MRPRIALSAASVLMAIVSFPPPAAGAGNEPKPIAVNHTDTYVQMDVTRSFQTTISAKTSALPPKGAKALKTLQTVTKTHLERGFDGEGNAVSVYSFPKAGQDPSKQRFGTLGRIEVVNDRLTAFDAAGGTMRTPQISGQPGLNLLHGVKDIKAYAPLGGIVVADPRAMVTRSKGILTLDDGKTAVIAVSDPKNRYRVELTYTHQTKGWVLTKQTAVSSTKFGSTQVTTTYANVVWESVPSRDRLRGYAHPSHVARPLTEPHTLVAPTIRPAGSPASLLGIAQPKTAAMTPAAAFGTTSFDIFLQHGFLSSGTTWSRMAPLLTQDLSLNSVLTPSAGSFGTANLDSWLPDMEGQLVNGRSYIGIGHSAGGLVSRELAQQNPALVRGVITVDSPQAGAPLVNNGTDQYLAAYIADALNNLEGDLFDASDPTIGFAVDAFNYIVGDFLANDALGLTLPATQDFKVGADYLNRLNSVPESFPRAAVVGQSDYTGLVYRLVGDSFIGQSLGCYPETCGGELFASVWEGAELGFEGTGDIYFGLYIDCIDNEDDSDGHCEDEWLYTADDYYDAAAQLDSIDSFWAGIVAYGASSDGVVPTTSQIYPNAPTNIVIPSADSHLGAPKSLRVKEALESLLTSQMFVTVAPCAFNVTGPGGVPIGAGSTVPSAFFGGSLSFSVSTASNCSWSLGLATGVETTGATSFTGPQTVTLWSDPNLSSGQVQVPLTIAGVPILVAQDPLPFNSGVGSFVLSNKPDPRPLYIIPCGPPSDVTKAAAVTSQIGVIQPQCGGPPPPPPLRPETIQVIVNDPGLAGYLSYAPPYTSPAVAISGAYSVDVTSIANAINGDPSSNVWAGADLYNTTVVLISKSTSAADYPYTTSITPAQRVGAIAYPAGPTLLGSN